MCCKNESENNKKNECSCNCASGKKVQAVCGDIEIQSDNKLDISSWNIGSIDCSKTK